MTKVAIVTDSTADIPPALLEGLPIFVAPLHVILGDESFKDNVDITPAQFYERLKTDKVLPKTSQVTPGEFATLYKSLLDQDYDILSLHLSLILSNTLHSALQAKNDLHSARIECIDSLTISMPLGFQALAAARAAVQGATLLECKKLLETARLNTNILFLPATLEYLHRGGRIGGAAALFGSMLNIKPILQVINGRVEVVDRVMTMNKGLLRALDLLDEKVGNAQQVHLASVCSDNPEQAAQLLEDARLRIGAGRICESFNSSLSPVIGTHTGPGSLGIAYMTE
jgi:DegV family protein with EDD domain